MNDNKNSRPEISYVLILMSMAFVTCLLLSNVLAAKMLRISVWSVSAGVLVFPISYIINDLLTEIYGLKTSKKIIIIGFFMLAFMVIVFEISSLLPSPDWVEDADAFSKVIRNTPRTAIASLLAYLLGSLVNAYVIEVLKLKQTRGFGFRAIVSTILGEFVDSVIFVPIAFLFIIPVNQLFTMIIIQVSFKTIYEIVVLPVTTAIRSYMVQHNVE